jgi:hypothetical protein
MRFWPFLFVVTAAASVILAACGSGGASTTTSTYPPVDASVDMSVGSPGAFGDGGSCQPKTCAQLGYSCGKNADGCDHLVDCGSCTAPEFCGGGGFSKCGGDANLLDGGGNCVPKTCAQLGYTCGPAGDGCGNLLQCGTCTLPQICGGGGKPSVCGNTVPCTGLCQNQVPCDGGTTTTFSGQVVGGTQGAYGSPDPVPNVLVYVPNAPVQPFTTGVQCNQCGADVTGSPLVQTTTDYLGNFTLSNVPVPPGGAMVPVVIQLGRWRRQLSFPVTACVNNTIGTIHMPRNKSEGDIPFTAISTGAWDAMECVLLKMGVDQAEMTLPGGGGRIEMYQGNGVDHGAGTPAEATLTNTAGGPTVLNNYDQVLLPCWGEDPRPGSHDYDANNVKTSNEQGNLVQYTTGGGRVFATHYSYSWLYNDAFSGTATWVDDSEPTYATATIQQTPSEVATFYKWMNALAINGAASGQFTMDNPRYNISAINTSEGELWVGASNPLGPYEYPNQPPAPATFPVLYTFNTPLGAPNQCGRVVFSAFHVTVVTSPSGSTAGETFPAECPAQPMSPQEKALEYLIWDLASCVPGPPPPQCTPLTCAQQNIGCGPAGDGCGHQIDCGTCTPPLTCGGGGVFAQCGEVDAAPCVPETCAEQNISCGPAADGCGDVLDCGSCVAPATCGGGGSPGVCGGATK